MKVVSARCPRFATPTCLCMIHVDHCRMDTGCHTATDHDRKDKIRQAPCLSAAAPTLLVEAPPPETVETCKHLVVYKVFSTLQYESCAVIDSLHDEQTKGGSVSFWYAKEPINPTKLPTVELIPSYGRCSGAQCQAKAMATVGVISESREAH